MAVNMVRDQDRLDGASNFVVWKARVLSVLNKNCVKHFTLRTIAIPVDSADNDKYEKAMARAKSIILNGVKDHVVPHIVEKDTANEMWEGPKEIVPAYFCAEKDVTRKSTVIIPDAERRTDRPLPRSVN